MRSAPLGALLLGPLLLGCAERTAAPPPPLGAGDRPVVAVLAFRAGGELSPEATLGGDAAPAPDEEELGERVARTLSGHLAAAGVAVVDSDVALGAAALTDRGAYDPRLASRVAKKVGANLVVLGAVSRYRERDGTAWAANAPASVAFQAALVRASDGAVLTVERFDYTQQALSENLLDLGKFVQAGGRWLTREEILNAGLRQTAERFAAALRGDPAGSPRRRGGRR